MSIQPTDSNTQTSVTNETGTQKSSGPLSQLKAVAQKVFDYIKEKLTEASTSLKNRKITPINKKKARSKESPSKNAPEQNKNTKSHQANASQKSQSTAPAKGSEASSKNTQTETQTEEQSAPESGQVVSYKTQGSDQDQTKVPEKQEQTVSPPTAEASNKNTQTETQTDKKSAPESSQVATNKGTWKKANPSETLLQASESKRQENQEDQVPEADASETINTPASDKLEENLQKENVPQVASRVAQATQFIQTKTTEGPKQSQDAPMSSPKSKDNLKTARLPNADALGNPDNPPKRASLEASEDSLESLDIEKPIDSKEPKKSQVDDIFETLVKGEIDHKFKEFLQQGGSRKGRDTQKPPRILRRRPKRHDDLLKDADVEKYKKEYRDLISETEKLLAAAEEGGEAANLKKLEENYEKLDVDLRQLSAYEKLDDDNPTLDSKRTAQLGGIRSRIERIKEKADVSQAAATSKAPAAPPAPSAPAAPKQPQTSAAGITEADLQKRKQDLSSTRKTEEIKEQNAEDATTKGNTAEVTPEKSQKENASVSEPPAAPPAPPAPQAPKAEQAPSAPQAPQAPKAPSAPQAPKAPQVPKAGSSNKEGSRVKEEPDRSALLDDIRGGRAQLRETDSEAAKEVRESKNPQSGDQEKSLKNDSKSIPLSNKQKALLEQAQAEDVDSSSEDQGEISDSEWDNVDPSQDIVLEEEPIAKSESRKLAEEPVTQSEGFVQTKKPLDTNVGRKAAIFEGLGKDRPLNVKEDVRQMREKHKKQVDAEEAKKAQEAKNARIDAERKKVERLNKDMTKAMEGKTKEQIFADLRRLNESDSDDEELEFDDNY